MAFYKSPVIPIHDATDLSIPQFMAYYNPDELQVSKVVHTETFSGDAITYGSLREEAGRAAWGLKSKLGLQPGDTLLALINNSVRESLHNPPDRSSLIQILEHLCPSRPCDMVDRRYFRVGTIHPEVRKIANDFLDLLIHRQRRTISRMFSRSSNQPILPLSKRSSALSRPLWHPYQ